MQSSISYTESERMFKLAKGVFPMQLTINGGEVRHPPPKPKVHCPACGRLVTLHAGGVLGRHTDPDMPAMVCSRAGTVVRFAMGGSDVA